MWTAWKESCCQVTKSGLITEVVWERISETSCLQSRLMMSFFLLLVFLFFAGEVFNFMVADTELLEAHGNHYKVSKKCKQKITEKAKKKQKKKKKTAANFVNSWAFGKGLGFGKTGHRKKKWKTNWSPCSEVRKKSLLAKKKTFWQFMVINNCCQCHVQILIGCHGNTNKMALACLVVDWVQGDHLVHLCVTMAALKERNICFEDPID